MLKRALLLVGCLVAGAGIGWAGLLFTGSEWWFLAVPAAMAAGWLVVGTPEQCANPDRPPE
jgi:hypothetical protein